MNLLKGLGYVAGGVLTLAAGPLVGGVVGAAAAATGVAGFAVAGSGLAGGVTRMAVAKGTTMVVDKWEDQLRSKKTNFDTKPAFGSVVYCQLGPVEHSGIYVGNNEIVQLNGKGQIEKVSLASFTSHFTTIDSTILYPCNEKTGQALGLHKVGCKALEMVGKSRNYNLILDNCHQFSSGCITRDFENADNFLWTLKHTFEQEFDCNVYWKQWKW